MIVNALYLLLMYHQEYICTAGMRRGTQYRNAMLQHSEQRLVVCSHMDDATMTAVMYCHHVLKAQDATSMMTCLLP